MDFVSGGVVDVAEQGTPSESSGADEERIEKPDVEAHDGNASQPPCCVRMAGKGCCQKRVASLC